MSNHAPVFTSSEEDFNFNELANTTGSSTPDHLSGTLNFKDSDKTDTHTTSASLRSGRGTTFSADKVEGLLRCAKLELSAVSLKDIAHAHPQYSIYYRIEFVPPGSRIEPGAEPAGGALVEASGYATVGWNTAAVREAAAENAPIIKQLLLGARIKVTGRQGDWYRVSADGKGRIGWVHKSDVGL